MSSLLFQASITLLLLLLPFLSFSTADDRILDVRDNPLINGKEYYIVPAIGDYDGYLGYNPKNDLCPIYIKNTDIHTPIKITIPAGDSQFIKFNERVSIAFSGSNPCNESLVWRRTLNPLARKEFITTGGVEGDWSFSISSKSNINRPPFYILKYWPSRKGAGSANVGLDENDELLGLTYYPTTVLFESVSRDPEISTA